MCDYLVIVGSVGYLAQVLTHIFKLYYKNFHTFM